MQKTILRRSPWLIFLLVLAAFFLAPGSITLLTLVIGSISASQVSNFATVFLSIFIEAAPFLVLGTLASGLVEAFVDQSSLQKLANTRPLVSALAGGLMGLFFPVCECGVVPFARRLFRKGLPIPAGVAFLMAAPVINPIVIGSTLAAFGFGKVFLLRVGLSFAIAVLTGLVFSFARTPWEILRPTPWMTVQDVDPSPAPAKTTFLQKIRQVLTITLDEFFEIGRYLIIGALIAAAMQTFIPQTTLLSVGKGPLLSVLVMIALAVLLSICSTVDAFVALGFSTTFSIGSILSFLVFGPMVDIKSILLFLRVFRPKPVLYLVLIPLLASILAGVWINFYMTY